MGSCMSSNSTGSSPSSNPQNRVSKNNNNNRPANSGNNAQPQANVDNTTSGTNTNSKVSSSKTTQSQTSSEGSSSGIEGSNDNNNNNSSQLRDALADNYYTGDQNQSVSQSDHGSVASTNNNTPSNSSKSKSSRVKILLLGSGESGKSTIVKQIKIIHQNGYTQQELAMYKVVVYQNLIDIAKSLVKAIKQFNLESDLVNLTAYTESHATIEAIEDDTDIDQDSTLEKKQELVASKKRLSPLEMLASASLSDDEKEAFDPELFELIKLLYSEPVVSEKLFGEYRSKFYIMDSATYFFENVKRIGSNNYIPTVNDVLRTRIKTTGIYETTFQMGGLNIHMYDVGGQRSERKKWIHCFENVTSIIFCVALSEYDQVLLEEKKQNRMAESLVLFDSVINSRWFTRTSIVLFLNKIDIFTEKIPRSPLENYFPDYSGGNDINKAAKYILWRFTNVNRGGLNIYPHLTQATDTSNIKLVLATVKETILRNSLQDSGIL